MSNDVGERGLGEGRALILVVERDPHVRALERYFLEEAGFEVELAADGAHALAEAQRLRPHIVITEILVPKMDGLKLCRKLKREPATASVLVLVFSFLAAQERASEAGADAFLAKPVNETALITVLEELLEQLDDGQARRGRGVRAFRNGAPS